MALAVTQRKSAFTTGTVSARTLTFDSTPASGSSVVVAIAASLPVTSVTDNKGNTYTRDLHNQFTSGAIISVWRSSNITGGASFIVTATLSSTGSRNMLWGIIEVDKALILDKQITKNALTNAPTTGALTGQTLGTEQFGVALFAAGTLSASITHPPEWSPIQAQTTTLLSSLHSRIWTPTSVVTVTWGLSGPRAWAAGVVTYRAGVSADFTGTPTSGAAPLSVDFTDASTGSPTAWSWNFGDGQLSTLQNPTNIYAAAGSYTVTLVASNATGSSTKVRTDYIVVDSGGSVGGTPTPPGIPNAVPPSFFDPWGPMGSVPGSMAFLVRHLKPPVSSPPPDAAETVAKPVLIPLVLRENLARLERASRNTAMYVNALLLAKILYRVDDTTFAIRGGGFRSDRAPTVDDDETIGAQVCTPWVTGDTAEEAQAWICAVADAGEAVWLSLVLNEGGEGEGGLTGTF